MTKHCVNNSADRELGAYWEKEFCKMAAAFGFVFTPMQIGHGSAICAFGKNDQQWERFLLPDVTVWTYPGQHHEIKHKAPTSRGTFGLEAYRFHALLDFSQETQQDVMYTIHNHNLSGGRASALNDIAHWSTAKISELDKTWIFSGCFPSWINGIREDKILQYFWPISLWMPLTEYWLRYREDK